MHDATPDPHAGKHSRRLVEHLTRLSLRELSPAVVNAARMRLIDAIGCGCYGAQMPWGKIITEFSAMDSSSGSASVFGRRQPLAAARAALCNGTAIHGNELDDVETGGQLHPGAVVIPAALAAAEQCAASGERLLLGIIAGYECVSRVGRAIAEPPLSFHMTGIAGPVGAAVAAGVTMNLSVEQILHAIGVACSCSAGIKSFTQGSGGMIKRLHAGRSAEAGVMACQLVERGFTAPLAAIDGRFGLLDAYGGDKARPEQLNANLGEGYIVSRIWTKVYPCCGFIHTSAQALETLRVKHRLQPSAIEKIRIGVQSRAVIMNGAVAPKETMAAQYSLPFAAAVALASDPRDPRSFEGAAFDDPTLCELARRVELHADAEIEAMLPHFACRVDVRLKSGATHTAMLKTAQGTPDDPCSDDEVRAKFRRLAAISLDDDAIANVLDIIGRIEQLPAVTPALAGGR
jgi:2-methylcitrate dehydratase PrpD